MIKYKPTLSDSGYAADFPDRLLEAACSRALAFQSVHYRTIKSMIEVGAEQQSLPKGEEEALAEPYSGKGRFCRDASLLLH